ncbi:MAG TPA: hypothetical protein VFL12_06875, partial [Thermoanaerobaculia bacterium]|nr:hypothetical protein [Thermoanaerobaculia bacterium]
MTGSVPDGSTRARPSGGTAAPWISARWLALALAGLLIASPGSADTRPTVLMVLDEDPDLPGLALIDHTVRETFQTGLPGGVEICSESLDLSQFREAGYDGLEREYF